MLADTSYSIIHRTTMPFDGNTFEFVGAIHKEAHVSFIWVEMTPRSGVRLHKHPYQEIFIIQEGAARFTIGTSTIKANGEK